MTKTTAENMLKKMPIKESKENMTLPMPEERSWRNRMPWIVAPLALLAIGSGAFFVVRRWRSDNEINEHMV